MSIEFKDEPVPLVTVKEDGQLEIAFEGLDFLSNLKNKKIAVLSINGPPKQNKTLLANSFIPFSPAFNASESTPGLVMWGKPISLENGTELIIIDSQGLDTSLPMPSPFFSFSFKVSTSSSVAKTSRAAPSSKELT